MMKMLMGIVLLAIEGLREENPLILPLQWRVHCPSTRSKYRRTLSGSSPEGDSSKIIGPLSATSTATAWQHMARARLMDYIGTESLFLLEERSE